MSLQAILEAIQASGDAQVALVEKEAAAQAEELRAAAGDEALQLQTEARARELQPAARERARLTQQARLDTLCAVGQVREALVDAALIDARRRLAAARDDLGYPRLLRRLVQEALDALAQSLDRVEHAQLEADPHDRELLGRIMQDLGLNLKVVYSLDCWGGVIASSGDGRIVVFNTLESRLERAMPVLRRQLAAHFAAENKEVTRQTMTMETPA